MKMDLQKIKSMLDAYQSEHGSVSIHSHENVNYPCSGCYTGGGCHGTCKGTCGGTCNAY